MFYEVPKEFYFRVHHCRPRFKSDVENVLVYMATEISKMNEDDKDSFANQLNSAIKRYPGNEVKTLNKIIAEYNVIINEMKNSFPGITQLECASVFKKIKQGSSQTIFEIMNQIHREISIQITLNEADNKNKNYLLPIDPYEIIDPFYNNPEHILFFSIFYII